MLSWPPGIQVFMAIEPVDLRKGFDGLSAAVQTAFDRPVLDGHLFLFLNRRRDRVKILWWDRDGLAIFYKKVEAHYPCFFLFTEFGGQPDNLARRTVAVGRMDSFSTRNGPRRRPMLREITVPAPPRAPFAAVPEVSPSCGVG